MVKITFLINIIFLIAFYTNAQQASDLITKQAELKSIKSEISSLEKEIQKKTKREKESFNVIQNFDKQNFLLNKVIGRYRTEQKQKETDIEETQRQITSLTKEIARLQANYSNYVKAIYKKSYKSDLAIIFDSESIAQALRRIFYLRKFSERREKDLINFEQNKNDLLTAKDKLEKEKAEKSLLMDKKLDEEKILKRKTQERKKILNAIKKDNNELKKELSSKKKAEAEIRILIIRLTEEKIKRDAELKANEKSKNEKQFAASKKEIEVTKGKNKSVVAETEDKKFLGDLSSFEMLKGKLNWPVNGGKIIRKFGENKNLILNTVTLNYGVDIKVISDLNVKAVSGGIISTIEWIPGYGSIIIITHSSDYRTVYGHLGEIYVEEGDKVKTGQIIASINESIEGHVLHFEIWSSRTNQNPEIWLAKK
jgi:septal ring factor EnvC (AmiA/AmiB activator)